MGSSSLLRVVAACFAFATLVAAQSDRFETILWRHGGPRLDAKIALRLKRAGVSAVSVDQGEDPARVRELGLRFYLDHAAGKGTLHLREPEFRAALEAYERSRDPKHLVRPRSLHDGEVRRSLLELLRKRVPRGEEARGPDDLARRRDLDDALCLAPRFLLLQGGTRCLP